MNGREVNERGGTLVCLHGFTGARESWQRLRELLPASWRLLAPELHGHGAASDDATTFAEEADRLAAELDRAFAGRPAHGPVLLVGYSLGARVALSLLGRHAHRFDRAVLIGVNPGLESDHERRRHADRLWIELLEAEGIEAFAADWQDLPLFVTQQRCTPEALAAQYAVRRAQDPQRLASSLRHFGLAEMPSGRDLLRRPPVPVTLVVGEDDRKFRTLAEGLLRAAEPCADLDLEVVPESGHNVLLEQPEALAQLLEGRLIDDSEAAPALAAGEA